MAFTPERFRSTILRLEADANRSPGAYRFRVALLAALGYAYIFLFLGFALALLAAFLYGVKYLLFDLHSFSFMALKLILPVGGGLAIFILTLFSALWVRVPEPDGIEIEREEAVPLFHEIDRLRGSLKVPKFHRVILTNDFNAACAQTPRLGVFGWQKNHLLIGIPLMATLSPEDFRAVLAHEMGHLSASHSRFGAWIYRLNETWMQLLFTLEYEDRASIIVFAPFFNWYAPLFYAYSFAIRRSDEYEADKLAARALGAPQMANALISSELTVRRLVEGVPTPVDDKTRNRWLNDILAAPVEPMESHPNLAARLRALGQKPVVPPEATEVALTRFFRHRAAELAHLVGINLLIVEGGASPAIIQPAPRPTPTVAPAPTMTTIAMPTLNHNKRA